MSHQRLVISCGECCRAGSSACDDCVVTFVVDGAAGAASSQTGTRAAAHVDEGAGLLPARAEQPDRLPVACRSAVAAAPVRAEQRRCYGGRMPIGAVTGVRSVSRAAGAQGGSMAGGAARVASARTAGSGQPATTPAGQRLVAASAARVVRLSAAELTAVRTLATGGLVPALRFGPRSER